MSRELRTDVLSDEDYEDLIAECYVDDVYVMTVNQERGFDELEVEVSVRPDGPRVRIDYDVMVQLLQDARTRLWELRRVPGSGEGST